MLNPKLIEAALGMLAKSVPRDKWDEIIAGINATAAYAKSADDRLRKLENLIERVDFLESIVRSNVDGAGAAFTERASWLHNNGTAIEAALAPAQPGALQNGGNPVPEAG